MKKQNRQSGSMKALSIKQPWASMIAEGLKTIETRTWPTFYRGELLIVSSKRPSDEGPAGKALAVAELIDCHRMTVDDEKAACCTIYPRAWAWVLTTIWEIEPFDVRGQLGIYEVDVTGRIDLPM